MNSFLAAVKRGDRKRVASALKLSDEGTKQILLESRTLGGFGPARVAIEVSDFEMLETILEHLEPEEFFDNTTALDQKTDFQRAIQMNPSLFEHFERKFGGDVHALLFQIVGLEDIDDHTKYQELWNRLVKELQPGKAHCFIMQAIHMRNTGLSLHLLNAYERNIDRRHLLGLALSAIDFGNAGILQRTLPKMKSSTSRIFRHILKSNQPEILGTLVKQGVRLTNQDLRCIFHKDVQVGLVREFLETGVFMKNISLPKRVSKKKWEPFFLAGYFVEKEKEFLRLGKKDRKANVINAEMITRRCLAVCKRNLYSA